MTIFLTLPQVIEIHNEALVFGGLHGIRDQNALKSAIETPKMKAFGEYLYPSIHDKAAAYLFHIVKNHAFLDANKRIGAASAQLFLRINGLEDNIPDDEYENFVVEIADGNVSKEKICAFLRNYTSFKTS